MEEYFTKADQLPKVFDLVTEMANLLNGGLQGGSGDGLRVILDNLKQEMLIEVRSQSSGFSTRTSGFAGLSLGQTAGQPRPLPQHLLRLRRKRSQRISCDAWRLLKERWRQVLCRKTLEADYILDLGLALCPGLVPMPHRQCW
jgi:hypothetical protein